MKINLLLASLLISSVALADNTSIVGTSKKTEMRAAHQQRSLDKDQTVTDTADMKARAGNLDAGSESKPLFGANKRQSLHKNSDQLTEKKSAESAQDNVKARIDPSVAVDSESSSSSEVAIGVNKKLKLRNNSALRSN